MDLSGLPARTTPDREYYGAIVDLLGEQNRMLAELVNLVRTSVGARPGPDVNRPPVASDPAPPQDDAPAELAEPVDAQYAEEESPVDEPIAIREPALTPPPASGPGSGRTAWAGYATTAGIPVDQRWNRDHIIQACRTAGIPT